MTIACNIYNVRVELTLRTKFDNIYNIIAKFAKLKSKVHDEKKK